MKIDGRKFLSFAFFDSNDGYLIAADVSRIVVERVFLTEDNSEVARGLHPDIKSEGEIKELLASDHRFADQLKNRLFNFLIRALLPNN